MRTGILSPARVATGLIRTAGIFAVTAVLLTQSIVLANAAEKYAAFIIDANNGKVLYSKYADDPRYPASLTKMMTLYLLFEAIQRGRTSLKSPMKVSAYAAARPPSKLGLKVGSTISVEEAILSLVTKSANDVAVVIGEHIGGSEERFAALMTAKARQLGMTRTTFRNANGLPDAGQKTTARDMATLGMALRQHFPREYGYFRAKSFNFRGRRIGNHNRLLGRVKGVDGIKTGYINASGFNLVSSIVSGDKKLVGVVMGGRTGASRDNEMAQLLNKYLPAATSGGSGLLVAEARATEPRVTAAPAAMAAPVATVAAYQPPARVPLPSTRSSLDRRIAGARATEARVTDAPADEAAAAATAAAYQRPSRVPVPNMRASVDQRIAAAYGSDAGDAIARMAAQAPRPIVGREALRAALAASPRARPSMPMPTMNSLAPTGPVPPGAIPGGADFDPTTTGSIKARTPEAPASPWVVQIAAMPDRDRALEMLAEAKERGGTALAGAQPFTEMVGNGSQALHRARFAGFQSKREASRACAALKKRAYNCYTLSN